MNNHGKCCELITRFVDHLVDGYQATINNHQDLVTMVSMAMNNPLATMFCGPEV